MHRAPSAPRRLRTATEHGPGWTALRLHGVIDERSGLDELLEDVRGDTVVVDLAGVARINSIGVRDWVNWVRALREAGRRVVLVDCSPAMMEQANLVRNFASQVWIHSFQAPYYCDRCDLEVSHRLDTAGLLGSGERRAPSFPCGKSACAKTFDDVEEAYFAFLEDQEVPPDAAALDEVVRQAVEALDRLPAEGEPPSAEPAPRPLQPLVAEGSPLPRVPMGAGGGAAFAPGGPAPPGSRPLEPPRSRAGELAFVAVLVVLGGLLVVLVYLMLTLE